MSALGDLAIRRVHMGHSAPTRSLNIVGEDYSKKLMQANVTYDLRSGGSNMSFQCNESLEGLEDSHVELWVGYGGRHFKAFGGTIQEPSNLLRGDAIAYGPFKLMADQSFGARVTYQGRTLASVFRDLGQRAGYGNGMVKVIGGDDITVEAVRYTEETMLIEAAKFAGDPAKFVFYDTYGEKRVAQKEITPAAGGKSVAHYSEANYPKDGFQITDAREGLYSKVVVFRRHDNGQYLVKEEAPVPQRGKVPAPANRVFYVSDFPGTAPEAKQEAYETAMRVAYGTKSFSLNSVWINPDLAPWESFTVETIEKRKRAGKQDRGHRQGKWAVTYQCLISDSLSMRVGPTEHHMDCGGGAIKLSERKISDPIRLTSRNLTPGVIVQSSADMIPGFKPDVTFKPDVNFKPDAAHI